MAEELQLFDSSAGGPVSHCTLLPALLQDDQDGTFVKWRVENSWGEDHGHKGELSLQILTQGDWSLRYSLPPKLPQCGAFFSY